MWLTVVAVILALILFLLFLKVRLCIVYDNEFSVKLKVLLFNIPLFPVPEKKPRPRDFSLKALERKKKKADKKALKKQKKQNTEQKTETAAPQKEKGEKVKEILELIKIVLEYVLSPFGRYLKIEIIKMHIRLGTSDPAKTAVLYGGVCQAVAYIVELLSNLTNVDVKKSNSITVQPDFFEGKTEAVINITLGLRVWHALALAIKFFMGYITRSNEKKAAEAVKDTL